MTLVALYALYTASHKKGATFIFTITLALMDQWFLYFPFLDKLRMKLDKILRMNSWTFKFCKVMWQQICGEVVRFKLFSSTVYLRMHQWKNYWYRSICAKVINLLSRSEGCQLPIWRDAPFLCGSFLFLRLQKQSWVKKSMLSLLRLQSVIIRRIQVCFDIFFIITCTFWLHWTDMF